jgi:hypothetical protein
MEFDYIIITVHFKPDNLGQMPRMTDYEPWKLYPGVFRPEREPSPSAYSLGDVAARQRPAGYRDARSRATWLHAVSAWCPCPGTRHVVPLVCCGRGDAEPAGPRRCQYFTSDRGVERGDKRDRGARFPSRPVGRSASVLFKQPNPSESLNIRIAAQRGRWSSRWWLLVDVHICLDFYELLINPRPILGSY